MKYKFSIGQRILLRNKISHMWEENYYSPNDGHDSLKLKEEVLPAIAETWHLLGLSMSFDDEIINESKRFTVGEPVLVDLSCSVFQDKGTSILEGTYLEYLKLDAEDDRCHCVQFLDSTEKIWLEAEGICKKN